MNKTPLPEELQQPKQVPLGEQLEFQVLMPETIEQILGEYTDGPRRDLTD